MNQRIREPQLHTQPHPPPDATLEVKRDRQGAPRRCTRLHLNEAWLDLDKNTGSSDFQTWVAHDRRRSRPLATSSVENPRSIAGETRSETPPSFALAEEHRDNEERNGYGRNGRLGKVRRPHDGLKIFYSQHEPLPPFSSKVTVSPSCH